MSQTPVDQHQTDYRKRARQLRSHPHVDGPTRKLVRSWIEHEPSPIVQLVKHKPWLALRLLARGIPEPRQPEPS